MFFGEAVGSRSACGAAPGAPNAEGGTMAVVTAQKHTHPALIRYSEERARNVQNRIADAITAFAGSMWFVYIHVLWFTVWIALRIESYPFGLLTMIVSLEAIFLSTFVMISQNRQDDARRHLADQEWRVVQTEEQQNEELITLSRQILDLTTAIHELTRAHTAAASQGGSTS
jgi:uncharacterized membrane protein